MSAGHLSSGRCCFKAVLEGRVRCSQWWPGPVLKTPLRKDIQSRSSCQCEGPGAEPGRAGRYRDDIRTTGKSWPSTVFGALSHHNARWWSLRSKSTRKISNGKPSVRRRNALRAFWRIQSICRSFGSKNRFPQSGYIEFSSYIAGFARSEKTVPVQPHGSCQRSKILPSKTQKSSTSSPKDDSGLARPAIPITAPFARHMIIT